MAGIYWIVALGFLVWLISMLGLWRISRLSDDFLAFVFLVTMITVVYPIIMWFII